MKLNDILQELGLSASVPDATVADVKPDFAVRLNEVEKELGLCDEVETDD